MMNVEQSVEWELAEETEVFGENLPHCHFVHHKSHMTWRSRGGKPATNRLSYGAAPSFTVGAMTAAVIRSVFVDHSAWKEKYWVDRGVCLSDTLCSEARRFKVPTKLKAGNF
jgi:hypothetical protein